MSSASPSGFSSGRAPGSSKPANVLLKELNAAFGRLKNLESTQQRQSSDIKIAREILCRLINEHLIDLDKVYSEIAKASSTGGTPQSMVIIELLALCTAQFPSIFASGPSPVSDETPALSQLNKSLLPPQDEEYHICKGLCTWVICQLLRLLSDSGFVTVHQKILSIISSILQLVKSKDLPMFHEFISEFINLMAELSRQSASSFESGAVESIANPVTLQYFNLSEKPCDIKEVEDFQKGMILEPIKIQFYCQLYLLQVATSTLVNEMLTDIIMCAADKLLMLWLTLACQLEDGQNQVKQLSMEALAKLWAMCGIPSEQVADYLIELFTSFLSMLFSKFEAFQSDVKSLEVGLSKCLNAVFQENSDGKPRHCLSADYIGKIFDTLYQGLTIYGLANIHTVELKSSICHTIQYIENHIPAGYESDSITRKDRMHSISAALLDHIGKDTNAQYLVGVFYQSIQNDLQICKISTVTKGTQVTLSTHLSDMEQQVHKTQSTAASGSTVILKSSSSEDLPQRKKKLSLHKTHKKLQIQGPTSESSSTSGTEDEGIAVTNLSEKSSTYSSLIHQLDVLMQHYQSDGDINQSHHQMICELEGIRAVLETLAQCNDVITEEVLDLLSTSAKPVVLFNKGKLQREKCLPWLTSQQSRDVCKVWTGVLKLLPSLKTAEEVNEVYDKIIQGIGSMLMMTGTLRLPADVLHSLTWMLSLPWLQMEAKWMDLRPHHVSRQDVAALSTSLADKIGPAAQSEAVHLLCFVPKEIASKWRIHVISAALGSSIDEVRLAAVHGFPVLMLTLGSNSHHLVNDCLHDVLKDTSLEILEEAAKVVGRLGLVLSKTACLVSVDPRNLQDRLHKNMEIKAMESSTVAETHNQPTIPKPLLLVPFLKLISKDNTTIKLAFIRSLHSVFPYLDLSSNNPAVINIINTCLELCVDPSYQVRVAFSKVVPLMIHKSDGSTTNEIVTALVTRLKSAFDSAKAHRNARLQETVMLTIGQLGRVAQGELLLVVIICLLDSMIDQHRIVTAAAYTELQSVAGFKEMKLADLFNLYKHQICKFVVDNLHESASSGNKDMMAVIAEVSKVFEFRSKAVFLSSTLKFTLPYLVSKATTSVSAILKLIAKTLDTDFRQMLVENFRFIFSYLVRMCNEDNLTKALTYVQALKSLVSVMKLMGPRHITAVRVKVMTTLKIGLRYKDIEFSELNCIAWDCLVHSVELSSLGPMLSQIIVTLLPLLHQLPEKVAEIYRYLIVENREALQEHFHEIYFIPDIPELAGVNAVLQEYKEDSASGDLCTHLKRAIQHVSHESLDVRIYALEKLKHLLHNNQAALHELILANENVHPVVSQLASVLLGGCREPDPVARNMFGECLGELGAIEPDRLDFTTNSKNEDINKFQATVEDTNFAYDLITELARAFLAAADPRVQDCSAYAMQEILQLYDCQESKRDNAGRRLWRRFPEPTQEILKPHLHTRYVPAAMSNWSSLIKPVYRSKKGKTFKDWVCTWTGYLLTKIRQEKASRVFRACSNIIKHDTQTALFLLPHIVIYALLDGSEDENMEICNEILAVLTHAEKLDEQQEGDFCHMSAQTVFSILDHLTQWSRHRLHTLAFGKVKKRSSYQDYHDDPEYRKIRGFLDKIPQDVLAKASFNCKAYTRSLMHFEAFITSKKQDIQQHLGFMQKLYVVMDEPDGVAGVSAIRQENPTLHEQILEHESIGQLRDASACYERAIQLESNDVSLHQGLLKSLMDLGQLSTALVLVNGVLAERPEWTSDLSAFRVEAAWKLGQWDSLENYVRLETTTSNWNIGLGKILLAAKKKDEEEFKRQLKIVRSEQMGPLSAASMENGSYQRGYEYIVRLHMLNEIERGVKCMVGLNGDNQDDQTDNRQQMLHNWQARLDITESSSRTQEPILSLRRITLRLAENADLTGQDKEIGKCWLQSARVARKAGHIQTAYSSLLNASAYAMPEYCLEKAKWLWSKGDLHQALISLQKGVEDYFPEEMKARLASDTVEVAETERLIFAKALLLIGRFMEATAKSESNAVMRQYKDVITIHKEWEDGHFYLAKYYDRIMSTVADRPEKQGEIVLYVVKHFGHSLQYGNQYIYQSMPRLLTLWLDFGAKVSEQEKSKRGDKIVSNKTVLLHLNKMIAEQCDKLAPYQYLTAFSQLISRVCHSHVSVFQQLREIIAKLLVVFPQQAVWMMMAVSKSTHTMRTKRCQDIFSRAMELNADLHKFIQDATKLQDKLLDVCNHTVQSSCDRLSMSMHFKSLKRMVEDENFSPIIVPLQSAMTVTLPSTPGVHASHNPFPGAEVYIKEFDDTIEVLPSLQKPKKIGIIGTDGKLYLMLCKPKDDLRKDSRLMEFNAIINKCLKKDAESRRRQLHIRTYAVIPLNEECGLLEWVPNTAGFRHIIHKIYKERNLYTSGTELKSMTVSLGASIEVKLNVFKNKLLPRFPPVFQEWFLRTFPDPTSWYMARLSYARTSAVMSIVGYILGLGDRHGENILFDSTNGDTVHVDFNCLFNKGETFDWPERVPFRLSQNMVEALGPMGHEGIFRRACEVTMKVMRDQTDPLISVLKTLIYDPLVEWSKPTRGRASVLTESGEINNEKAMTHVKDIEQRLQGKLKNKNKTRGLPLSVEGHVHYLIQEATDERNLCQMYIGWAPFL
ncbi:serine/threonine-protein kinase ATR-like isoform X2 [Ptychodera flava]|uniref:serine/threonine-protein kinase ATR-like isoform X2 n=1 Tax=Ptychodera flava TaxID=63121 RepID=UPI00396AA6E8